MKSATSQQEWLKMLDKGMITLPKAWRNALGLTKGSLIKARKQGDKVVIEPAENKVPYRLYTDKEIKKFLEEDKISPKLSQKIDAIIKARS